MALSNHKLQIMLICNKNQKVLYFYDLQSRLVKEVDRNGQEINYEYNSDDLLTLEYADNIEGQTLYHKYLYNQDGSLLAAITPETVDQLSYTPNGNLYQKIHNGELELEYGYNRNGSITSVKDKSQMETRYTYDAAGRLETVLEGQSQMAQYSYNPDSTVSQMLFNTGVNVTYQYDRDKNITNIVYRNQSEEIISSYAYTYDNNGNRKTRTENGETTYYTYDSLNKLSMVKYPTAGTEDYTYDNAGNRLTKTNYNATGGVPAVDISTIYTYDSLNRMTESLTDDILLAYKGRTVYQYDSNGSLLKETTTQLDYTSEQVLATDPVTGLPLQPQIKSYSYNAFNQNVSVINADGSFQQNIYDALGLRISTIENGYRSDFVFDRGNIIAEFDGSGTLKNRNIRGYTLLAQKDEKGRLSYYLHDAHGDITGLIDASGKVLNSYQYDAFGNTMISAETVSNRFRYAGEQLDPITGQYYLRARYYDPQVGRFTQEDTYRGDGMNLYAYVGNNPVNFIDPSGHAQVRGDGVSGGGKCSQGFSDDYPTFGNQPNIVGNSITGTMPSPFEVAGQAMVRGLVGFSKKVIPFVFGFEIWWNNPIECYDDGYFEYIEGKNKVDKKDKPNEQEDDKPEVKYPGDDPTQPPGEGYEWRGKPGSKPGDKDGSWYNPQTGESLHPDLGHGDPVGPHYDYKGPQGGYRVFPDGRILPK